MIEYYPNGIIKTCMLSDIIPMTDEDWKEIERKHWERIGKTIKEAAS